MQPKFYMPKIRDHYSYKLKEVLKDDNKKYDRNSANNFILERQIAQNYMRGIKFMLELFLISFFSSIIWVITVSFHSEDEENFHSYYEKDFGDSVITE